MTPPVAPAVGQRIKQARLQLGISQDQLARRLDVSMMTVSKWECGYVKRPDRYAMSLIEEMLGYPEGFIMYGDEVRTSAADDMRRVKVSSRRGHVLVELLLDPGEVDAVVHGLRKAKAEALRLRVEEGS